MHFDPSSVAVKNGQFFGFPYSQEEAEIVFISVPWDVSTSYRDGTCAGPLAMLEASYQLDFTSPYKNKAWETRIATMQFNPEWLEKNRSLRMLAKDLISFQENGGVIEGSENESILEQVNLESAEFHQEIEAEVLALLHSGKKVITVGGDHSVSFGPIYAHSQFLASQQKKISILHIDAHADLRDSYEGFPHSHASIMRLVSQMPEIEKIVQVGIRDLAPDEMAFIQENDKLKSFFDWDLARNRARGISWDQQCDSIIESLGQYVYISFDIDGLDPRFCPNTGTPVPGGLELSDTFYLFEKVVASGRTIVGADLVEVAPGKNGDEWDANVGARILFQLAQFLSL